MPAPAATLPTEGGRLVLLHNPRCSKSRAALALLEERGVSFETRPYLEQPLGPEELRELRRRLGRPVREWVRRKDAAFSEAGLSDDADEETLLEALARQPALLERPILVAADRAVVGRPPEDVLKLL